MTGVQTCALPIFNERRNQLHEVIRLSGMNLIINDTDHPLIIKVASIQAARMQVYFIDNEDYFQRKYVVSDESGSSFPDNDERAIFFARGVFETVKKLRWSPDLIYYVLRHGLLCRGGLRRLVLPAPGDALRGYLRLALLRGDWAPLCHQLHPGHRR